MNRLLILAVAAALVAGCGSDDDSSDDDGPVLTDGALVTFTQTGGVAGMDERLRIEPEGNATVTLGEPFNTERSFELTDAELERITTLLEAADFDSMPVEPEPTGCADCFVYTVEYAGDSITYDDATEADASIAELVAGLREVVDSNQPAPAGYIKGG